jgi:hypothetical protein
MDVAINTDAMREEIASGRPLLNFAHACFSAAVAGASIATGLLRAAGAGPPVVFLLATALVAVAALFVRPLPEERRPPPTTTERPRFLARVPVWLLVLGFVGRLPTGSRMHGRAGAPVHLERTLDASPALGALGPAVFAASIAVGRLPSTASRGGEPSSSAGASAAALAALTPSAPSGWSASPWPGRDVRSARPTIVSVAGWLRARPTRPSSARPRR